MTADYPAKRADNLRTFIGRLYTGTGVKLSSAGVKPLIALMMNLERLTFNLRACRMQVEPIWLVCARINRRPGSPGCFMMFQ